MPLRSCSSVTGTACHVLDLRLRRDVDAGAALRRVGIVLRCPRPVGRLPPSSRPEAPAAAGRREMLDTLKIGPLSHQIARLSV